MKFIKDYGIPFIGVLLLSAFPVIFMYCANSAEADFIEAVEPLLVFCGIGAVLYVVFSLFSRTPGKSALASGLIVLCFTNYKLIEDLIKLPFPNLKYWHTLPIITVLCVCAVIAVMMFVPKEAGNTASLIMCAVFGGLTVVNFVTAVPGIVDKVQAKQAIVAAREETSGTVTEGNEDLPNVYHLIFDEYANFPQMQEYYDYDNAVLEDFLLDNDFTISYDSHNESIMTSTVVTNLLNLNYVVDNYSSASEKEVLRKNNALFELMRNNGYNINAVGSGTFITDVPFTASASTGATTAAGEDLKYLIYENTPIHPFHTLSTSKMFMEIKNLTNYLASDNIIPEEPTYTIGYINFPHTPFLVDENGDAVPLEFFYVWSDNRYYLGQYKYATKEMIRIVTNILEKDPDSIIIVQSDHGARASTETAMYFVKFPLNVMNNPFNVVYYRGENISEIQGQSSVNTLRLVFSRLFNEEYELVEVPEDTYDY